MDAYPIIFQAPITQSIHLKKNRTTIVILVITFNKTLSSPFIHFT